MVGRGAKMSKALTQKARDSEFPDMDECTESSRGSETSDGRSKRGLRVPLTFLLSRRSMLPELPAGRFCGIGKLIARISSSRMWSCSLRLLLDLRRPREVSLGGPLRNDWGRCSFPRSLGKKVGCLADWLALVVRPRCWVHGHRPEVLEYRFPRCAIARNPMVELEKR